MVNLNKFDWLLRELDLSLLKLQALSTVEHHIFLNDEVQCSAAKYYVQTAIEACLQISQHILTAEDIVTPTESTEIFQVLSEHAKMPKHFTTTLKRMAEFQHRLIHRPWDVVDEDVYNILQYHLTDFDQFKQHLHSFLHPEPSAE